MMMMMMMMIWCFISISLLFKSFRDERRVITKAPCNEAPNSYELNYASDTS